VRVDGVEAVGGLRICQCKAKVRGLSHKPKNQVFVARFWAHRVKQQCGVTLGGGGCALMTWRRWWGCVFANVRPGGRIWARNPKPSAHSSVSGTLCKTAVWGDAGMWWARDNSMEAVGGLHIRQREAGGLGGAHLVTWHPCCCHSCHLFSSPSLPTPTPSWNHLPTGVSFICSWFGGGCG
jgi:hypothetical protein